MHANMASIMPQVIPPGAEAEGHDVTSSATGARDSPSTAGAGRRRLHRRLFTEAALLAYSLSTGSARRAPVTGWGGPHAAATRRRRQVLRLRARLTTAKSSGRAARLLAPPPRECTSRPTSSRCSPRRAGALEVRRGDAAQGPGLKIVPMLSPASGARTRAASASDPPSRTALDLDVLKGDLRFLLVL